MSDDTKGESFADLFAREQMPAGRARKLNVGDQVEGVVTHIGVDEIFVDLDAKQQAWFSRLDLLGPHGELRVKVGDRLKGHVVEIDESSEQVKLGSTFGKDAGREQLMVARDQGIPMEGKVTGINKGGAEVEIAGQRGFCPISQLDARYVEDPASYVGQTFRFLVVELSDRDVVLSRRRLLEREADVAREQVLENLQEGASVRGRVTQIREFGAFVDLGGIEGLVPMRELSHDRVARAEDVLSVGDVVEVKVQKVEPDGNRTKITLSLKALAADPWDGIEMIAPIGKVIAGQVTKLADFGAFIRIASGVEGLLHVSELPTARPEDAISVGQQVLVVTREIDRARHRLSLALANDGSKVGEVATSLHAVTGAVVKATVEKHERFGVFVQVVGTQGRAGRGLVPTNDLGLKSGVDARKELPIGTEITAKVMDATEGRMRLSVRAAGEDAERAVFDTYRDAQAKGGMGTFGDLLKAKLNK